MTRGVWCAELFCARCKAPVPPSRGSRPRRFCTKICARAYNHASRKQKTHTTVCRSCGVAFTHNTPKQYCSEQCRREGNLRSAAKWRHRKFGVRPPSTVCRGCAAEFAVISKNGSVPLYCSLRCRWRAEHPVNGVCLACGAALGSRHQRFSCSESCKEKAYWQAILNDPIRAERRRRITDTYLNGLSYAAHKLVRGTGLDKSDIPLELRVCKASSLKLQRILKGTTN